MRSRFIAVVLSLILLSGIALPMQASALSLQDQYDAALRELDRYMRSDPQANLTTICDNFFSLGSYEMSFQLRSYAGVLKGIEGDDYSQVFQLIAMLKKDPQFGKFIEEKSFGTLSDLEQYAYGRQAELNVNQKAAIERYEQCFGFLDSMMRWYELSSSESESKYQEALRLYETDTYEGYQQAFVLFSELREYRDSAAYAYRAEMLRQTPMPTATPTPTPTPEPTPTPTPEPTPISAQEKQYLEANALFADGKYARAALIYHSLGDYRSSDELKKEAWKQEILLHRMATIDAGYYHSAGITKNGLVATCGRTDYNRANVSSWQDVIAVSVGYRHTVGLRANGMVLAVGQNSFGQCNVAGWRDIAAISTSGYHTVGLKKDGTVVAAGVNDEGQCNVSRWSGIAAIAAGQYHTVGLMADGTVVTAGGNPYANTGECDVSAWENIVAIDAGTMNTVGLKSNGTVIVAGNNAHGQCNTSR